eukprot:GHVU01193288.1.p1 GENE.GHVU01193288.1~~GHVU01193288.1.p1  ORF type:complete len:116 (+),score=3.74 GHVU01193288.1:118-465(+)
MPAWPGQPGLAGAAVDDVVAAQSALIAVARAAAATEAVAGAELAWKRLLRSRSCSPSHPVHECRYSSLQRSIRGCPCVPTQWRVSACVSVFICVCVCVPVCIYVSVCVGMFAVAD